MGCPRSMTRLELPYVQTIKDRHGKTRHYFRRDGFPRAPLPGAIGSDDFMRAYGAALDRPKPSPRKAAAGTIGALVPAWYRSSDFKKLAASTQRVYRNIAERFGVEYSDLPVAGLEAKHIRRVLSTKAETPGAANNLLKVLRMMLRFAVEDDWITDDPTRGVRKIRHRTDGHHSWTEGEIAQFEAFWPIGSRARLALALLLYTAQRRSDVVRMGKQHVEGGAIFVVQQKTGKRLEIPLHRNLIEVIEATPSEHLTFLTTSHGASFTSAGFGNLFREMCDQAGLPKHCAAHGLRKAALQRLADRGGSAHQLKAYGGHESLSEVEQYTRASDQKQHAKQAMDILEKPKS